MPTCFEPDSSLHTCIFIRSFSVFNIHIFSVFKILK
jgi:hypothetical protein